MEDPVPENQPVTGTAVRATPAVPAAPPVRPNVAAATPLGPRRRRWKWWAAGGLVVVVLAAGGWWLWAKHGTSGGPGVADNAGIHKIKHVVVIMQENRSFDS